MSLQKRCVFISFLTFTIFSCRAKSEEVPEFQFACYVDVCTFPHQFCNSDKYERRCSPCTKEICQEPEDHVPEACKYICIKYKIFTTLPAPSLTAVSSDQLSKSTPDEHVENRMSLYLLMAYSAVTATASLVLLIVFIACYVHRKLRKKGRELSQNSHVGRKRNNQDEETSLLEQSLNNPTECRQLQRVVVPNSQSNIHNEPNDNASAPPMYKTIELHMTKPAVCNASTLTQELNCQDMFATNSTRQHTLNTQITTAECGNDKYMHHYPCSLGIETDINFQTALLNTMHRDNTSRDRENTNRKLHRISSSNS